MKLKILGCSGGVGGKLRTTSMLLDHDILIDAGTGVGDLSLDELARIDYVFLTHAHLDHIAFLPFMLDSVAGMRDRPLTVFATEETIAALQQHIFNWKIWPDFRQIPSLHRPCMRYEAVVEGKAVVLDGRTITPLPANHVVPAVGYYLNSGKAGLVFTGDTTSQDTFWERVNRIDNLAYLIIETAFPNSERELALQSKHLCPSMLAEELRKFRLSAEVYITHLKPDESDLTMLEITACIQGITPKRLMHGQEFEF